MKRAAMERDRTVREWREHYLQHLAQSKWGPSAANPTVNCVCDKQPGRFRKRKAHGCGNSRCQICHSHKYPKRKLSFGEVRAEIDAKEQMN